MVNASNGDSSMTQAEVLHELNCNTHTLFAKEFVDKVNEAFGTKIKCWEYRANPHDPKGLTLDNGAKMAVGMAAFDLAKMLCRELNVKYESKMGRGFQVRACTEALKNAGYGNTPFDGPKWPKDSG